MGRQLPKILASFALATGVLATAACNAAAPSGGGDGDGDGPSFVMVTPEPAGANEFLLLAEDGIAQAAEELGGSSQVYESQDPTKINEQLDAAIAEQPDVIAVVGFEFVDSIDALAPEHEDQKFVFIDACTVNEHPNVTCAVFREHEGVYLAGVEAALISKTQSVGAVVALDTPQIRRFSDPFGAGAAATSPGIAFSALFVGGNNPFNDPGRAKEQALSLASGGADVLIAASAAGNAGVFDAAKSAGIQAIGVDTNQCPQAPGTILDNVVKEVDVAVVEGVKSAMDGESGLTSYGIAEGGVSLTGLQDDVASSECTIADHPEVIEQVKQVSEQIKSGAITVTDPATQ